MAALKTEFSVSIICASQAMNFSSFVRKTSIYTCITVGMLLSACSDPNSLIVSPGKVQEITYPPITNSNEPREIDLVPTGFVTNSKNLEIGKVTLGSKNSFNLVKISDTITEDLTLRAKLNGSPIGYFLDGIVTVGKDLGAGGNKKVVLTVEPGVTIYGSGKSSQLIVSRGSQIIAKGNSKAPIVFTSLEEYERQNVLNHQKSDATEEWVGLIINGRAPINNCISPETIGNDQYCQNDGEANSGKYGGNLQDDNSGELNYVRVEFAGITHTEEDQSNGIAFQGVGSGTKVSNIQVHNNGDDGIEFFGGTVSATNIVITGAKDDSIDWTDGWQGTLQNLLVIQSEGVGDRMIEADNHSLVNPHESPRSKPKIANFTLIGNGNKDGILLREGTGVELYNGIVTNAKTGIVFGDRVTYDLLNTPHNSDQGKVVIESLILDNENVTKNIEGNNHQRVQSDTIKSNFGSILDLNKINDELKINKTNFIPGPAMWNIPTPSGGVQTYLGSGSREYLVSAARPVGVTLQSKPLEVKAAFGLLPLTDLSNVNGLKWKDKEYIGAFAPSETQSNNWAYGWTKPETVFKNVTVSNDTCPVQTTVGGRIKDLIVCELTQSIKTNLTLEYSPGVVYRLNGQIFVGEDGGPSAKNKAGSAQATLTIEPGVTIFGDSIEDGLVITRGSKIIAEGTEVNPIVMTSGAAIRGTADYVNDSAKWLGLTINGKAGINKCKLGGGTSGTDGGTDQCQGEGEASTGQYGGSVDGDNSGSLKFVRVEFAGNFFTEEDQSNGIAFQGVGSGTSVEYIQVHNNGDDGIEFFGGTVNAKHVVITGAGDDSVDWTDGWRGNIQYLIIEQRSGNDMAFEGDNFSEAAPSISPRSSPDISNFTILGKPDYGGIKLREGTAGRYVNGIIAKSLFGIDIDDPSDHEGGSYTELDEGNLILSSIFIDSKTPFVDDSKNKESFTATNVKNRVSNLKIGTTTLTGNNTFYDTDTNIGFVLGTAEVGAVSYDPRKLNDDGEDFFENSQYIGAVKNRDDKWYLGWTVNHLGNITEK